MNTKLENIIVALKRRIANSKRDPQTPFIRGYTLALEHALGVVELEIECLEEPSTTHLE